MQLGCLSQRLDGGLGSIQQYSYGMEMSKFEECVFVLNEARLGLSRGKMNREIRQMVAAVAQREFDLGSLDYITSIVQLTRFDARGPNVCKSTVQVLQYLVCWISRDAQVALYVTIMRLLGLGCTRFNGKLTRTILPV